MFGGPKIIFEEMSYLQYFHNKSYAEISIGR